MANPAMFTVAQLTTVIYALHTRATAVLPDDVGPNYESATRLHRRMASEAKAALTAALRGFKQLTGDHFPHRL